MQTARPHAPLARLIAMACAALSITLWSTGAHAQGSDDDPSIEAADMSGAALASARQSTATGTSASRDALRHVRRIVIDPGHGGRNEGAVGVGALHEKHLTLPISMFLADRLEALHPEIEVVLTRQSDIELGLTERAEIANAEEADLFLSIHLNAAVNERALGYETYTVEDVTPVLPPETPLVRAFPEMLPNLVEQLEVRRAAAAKARAFSRHLHAAYSERLDTTDRGLKRGNYTVLRKANVPAVVIEFGFLSHAVEGMRLMDPSHQRVLVDAIIDGIERYDASRSWPSGEVVAADGPAR